MLGDKVRNDMIVDKTAFITADCCQRCPLYVPHCRSHFVIHLYQSSVGRITNTD